MQTSIRTNQLSVTINSHGAELCSLRDAAGAEYLWQADPAVWPRHAPILFPIVGRLAGDSYRYGGELFAMKQHGFARDSEFEVVAGDADSVTLRFAADESTRVRYPFDFELFVRYRIAGNVLSVGNEVRNNGVETMIFSLGAHPGFSCSWRDGDRIGDYYLEFEAEESADAYFLRDGLFGGDRQRVLDRSRVLPLTDRTFDRDAMIFRDLKSTQVSLCRRDCAARVTVAFPDFPFLGIWSKPGAPFVCIEPWFGHADPVGHNGDLAHKPGTLHLQPGRSFACEYRIIVAPG